MTLNELMSQMLKMFPYMLIDEHGGELVIYTGFKSEGANENLVPLRGQ